MNAIGHISEVTPNEGFYAFVPFPDTYLLEKRQITDVGVEIADGRIIRPEHRSRIYATLRDISNYTGHSVSDLKDYFKVEYMIEAGCDWFSLSDVDVTTAHGFLEILINFCLEWDIPTNGSLSERTPDIARYIYWCLVHKKCCISQKKAQLHHVDAVGIGRNRNDIIHYGMRVLPLHWRYHQEVHNIGKISFEEKYHVFGIKLDSDLCDIWKVKN